MSLAMGISGEELVRALLAEIAFQPSPEDISDSTRLRDAIAKAIADTIPEKFLASIHKTYSQPPQSSMLSVLSPSKDDSSPSSDESSSGSPTDKAVTDAARTRRAAVAAMMRQSKRKPGPSAPPPSSPPDEDSLFFGPLD